MKILKKGFVILGLAVALSTTTSCSIEEGKYNIKSIDIYRKSNTVDKKIDIRFYNDNPNVPYIGVKEYFKEFYNTDLSINKNKNVFEFKKGEESYIKIDTINELLEIKGVMDLSNHPDKHTNNEKKYFKLDSKVETTKQYKAIDLNNYNILTYGSNNDVYMPVGLLSNLYGGIYGYTISYNGKSLYVLDQYGELGDGTPRNDSYYADTYYEILSSKENRYEDLAKYNYNQLCFTFDNLRGYTSQLVIGDHNLQTIGLNSVLESYYPDIKKLLLSTTRSDYDKGIMLLLGSLYDGGHTGLLSKNPPNFEYYSELKEDSRFKDLVNKFMAKDQLKSKNKEAYTNAKTVSLGTDYASSTFGYHFDNTHKVAYIAFDRFVVDTKRWDQYYNGDKSKLEEMEVSHYGYDTYAFVRKSLYDAKKDGAQTVVFDFTTNGGGDIDAVMGVMGLINQAKASQTYSNIVDKSRTISKYSIDINLDGKFDDEDVKEAKAFDFKVVGLTSPVAFSSGNYMPSLMKSLGFKILGDKSGGGACAITRETTADGYLYARSGYYVLCDEKGNEVDSGVSVDYSLVTTKNDGSLDLSKVYDSKTISEYLNK